MKTERLFLELRAAEGGSDAKDLVHELCRMYIRACTLHGL